METRNEKKSIIWRQKTFFVISMMAMMILFLSQIQVLAAGGTTVYVSTSDQLKTALANTSVEKIIFSNNITATSAMPIAGKRASSELIIDGNGYTFTERRHNTYSTCYGIYLTSTTTISTIAVENMNIVGGNGYGTIYTTKGVSQVFKNVTYKGPQIVYNNDGAVRFEDCAIDIGTYNNSYNGEVAEVNQVVLAGNVTITKQKDNADEIFWLKSSGASITVENGANVNINNNHYSTAGSMSGLIYASCSYNFTIGDNAVFNYIGTYQLEQTCLLNDFRLGNNAQFNVTLGNGLGASKQVIKANNTATIGNNAVFNVVINGSSSGYVLYACKGITIGNHADVDIKTGEVKSAYVMKSYYNDITVKDGASVNIETGAVTCGYVVKAFCGSVYIGKDAEFIVNSNGAMKTSLMWVKRNLTVEEGARLDLIANNNTNPCCNYVLNVDGCTEAYRSTITYKNPKRVLTYNDNKSGKSLSHAVNLGNYTTVNFDVNNTQYWNSASKTGGSDHLQNATYQWYQGAKTDGTYNVSAASKSGSKGFNQYFNASNYKGSYPMNASQYYFGKLCCKNRYEVCLWGGGAIEKDNPIIVGTKTVKDTVRTDGNTVVGNTLQYTVMVQNKENNSTWENVVFKDTLPLGVEFNQNSKVYVNGTETQNYTYQDGVLTLPLGTYAGETLIEVSFTVTVNEDAYSTKIVNTADVVGDNGAVTVKDDGIDVISDTPIPSGSKVSKNLSRESQRGQVGDIIEYTITVSNDKTNSVWADVYVWDTIPEEVDFKMGDKVYLDGAEAAYTYDDSTRILTVALGDIQGGKMDGIGKDIRTLVFTAIVNEKGYGKYIYNTANIDSNTTRRSISNTMLTVVDGGQRIAGN